MALLAEDPDAPGGTWIHWLAYDFAPTTEIPEAATGLGDAGLNSWRRTGYGPPCPPFGIHRYVFRIYALEETLRIGEGADATAVRRAMQRRLLAEAVLMGRYGR